MIRLTLHLVIVAVACAWLAGCGHRAPPPPSAHVNEVTQAAPPTAEQGGYRRRTIDSLPAVGQFAPPLDDGRVELAPPAGWQVLADKGMHLIGWVKDNTKPLPRILVTADDSPLPVLGHTTTETADKFVEILDPQIKAERPSSVPERCKPIILGDTVFIRHVRLALISQRHVAIQSLQTVQGGRLYTIELYCELDPRQPLDYATPLTDERNNAYAVAANMKFAGAAPPAADKLAEKSAAAPASQPASETPAP